MTKRRAKGEGGITERKDGRFQGTYYVQTSKGCQRRYLYGKSHKEVADNGFDPLSRTDQS